MKLIRVEEKGLPTNKKSLWYKKENVLLRPWLLEGLTRSYERDFTIRKLMIGEELTNGNIFKTETRSIVISGIFSDTKKESIIKSCDFFGYYLSRQGYIGSVYWMEFEPKFEPNADKEVRNIGILFHATPRYNFENIMNKGLSPRNKNTEFKYPERIYFMSGRFPKSAVNQNANALSKSNLSKGNNGEYAILTIDVSKIKENIHFYRDENAKSCYYTKDNIPKECIIGYRFIKCETPPRRDERIDKLLEGKTLKEINEILKKVLK